MKVTEILPGKLYQSARFNRSGMSKEEKLRNLASHGIDVVVSLVDYDPDMGCGDAIHYIQSAQPDSKYMDYGNLCKIAHDVSAMLDAGHIALVHCNGGRNRSGLLNALIVMLQTKCSGKQALEYVRNRRPNAIATQAFEEYLLHLDYKTLSSTL